MNSPAPHPAPGTPLPWTLRYSQWPDAPYADSREVQIIAPNGTSLGFTMQGRVDDLAGNADAAYLVTAANAYPALVARVAALEGALAGLLGLNCIATIEAHGQSDSACYFATALARIGAARALLAERTGEGAQ